MMRSPPPPGPPSHGAPGYGSPYGGASMGQATSGGGSFAPAFGSFMNDQTAQMGFQVGKSAVMAGQEYMEQNINRYVSIGALKHYFNVTTPYVLRKLLLVLFPWRHKPWSRQQRPSTTSAQDTTTYSYYFLPPRDDLNSPDMYIPVMAFVTYILLSTLLAGLRGAFHPEVMGLTATAAFAIVVIEILGLKFGTYILSISNDSQLLDLVAYSGYKFVGVIVTLVISEILNAGRGTGGWAGWTIFTYTFLANAFFLLRSLKYVLLPDSSSHTPAGSGMQTVARSQRNRRTQFLFLYSYVVQFVFMWILTRQDSERVGAKVAS
ncbi:Hrf1 [Lasallia pustulata]|uniref:Protein YIF1 n=1 Tax=Lasallia pustulata TaxID=136370 RepID=A0A1W5DBF9_9LECA|nr:Hrf1 [Lasallia pustulata]